MREWADLPDDVLNLVLSKLFAKDRHSFSLVCKDWNSAAKVSPYRHSPCLMFYQKNNFAWKIFQYNSFFHMDFPKLKKAEICCSKYGWMLMSRDDLSMFFYDPFNDEVMDLPKGDRYYNVISFFHPPTSQDCFIVGLSSLPNPHYAKIGVLKHGEGEWKSGKYEKKNEFMLSSCTPVLHRGLLYCLDAEGNVATFDLKNNGSPASWFIHTNCLYPAQLRPRLRQHFLIKLDEERRLLAVLVAHDERKVCVFRLSEPGMKWKVVEDLGGKVLFVSRFASFAATAPLKCMANRIYFPKMIHGGDSCVFYSMETRKYHSLEGDYSSPNSYGINDLNFATWITPTPTPEFPRDLRWIPRD